MSKYPLYSTLILLMPEIAVFFFAFCAYILGKFTHLNQKAPFHCFSLFFSIIGLFLSLLPLFFYHHILSLEPDLNLYTPAVHLNLEIICVKILIIILAIISLFFFKNAIAKSKRKNKIIHPSVILLFVSSILFFISATNPAAALAILFFVIFLIFIVYKQKQSVFPSCEN